MAHPNTKPAKAHSPSQPSLRSQPCDSLLLTDTVRIEHLHYPPGEASLQVKEGHTLFMNLTARPITST